MNGKRYVSIILVQERKRETDREIKKYRGRKKDRERKTEERQGRKDRGRKRGEEKRGERPWKTDSERQTVKERKKKKKESKKESKQASSMLGLAKGCSGVGINLNLSWLDRTMLPLGATLHMQLIFCLPGVSRRTRPAGARCGCRSSVVGTRWGGGADNRKDGWNDDERKPHCPGCWWRLHTCGTTMWTVIVLLRTYRETRPGPWNVL